MIPATAHFIWLGAKLPVIPWLAVRSALARGGFERVVLHGDEPSLADDPATQALLNLGVELRILTTEKLFGPALGDHLRTDEVQQLVSSWRELDAPAKRADLARLALLWRHGGVYIDADAITLRPFTPLLEARAFAGLERIALPEQVRSSANPLRWAGALGLLAARDVLSRLAIGPQLFGAIEALYTAAVNNAVLGCEARHETFTAALRACAQMPSAQRMRLYEIGPRLFQRLTRNTSTADFTIHPPPAFFPVPPEMSLHYFRVAPASVDRRLLADVTRVAHLYDSVAARRLGRPLTADWLLSLRDKTPLTRMVAPFLDDAQTVFGVSSA